MITNIDIEVNKMNIEAITLKCLGGGRINIDPDHKNINIYGVSEFFGKADH